MVDHAPPTFDRIGRLPLDPKLGVPVPWFVAYMEDGPDFRVVPAHRFGDAIKLRLCWVCGYSLGSRYGTFVLGPMCTVTRTAPEPPAHRECAIYSATHCPFLNNPDRRRRESRMADKLTDPDGIMIRRNPGVTALWTSRTWKRFPSGHQLINVGDPESVTWWAEGREATRAEVLASIESGLPLLMAEAEAEGPDAVAELEQMRLDAMAFLPPAELESADARA